MTARVSRPSWHRGERGVPAGDVDESPVPEARSVRRIQVGDGEDEALGGLGGTTLLECRRLVFTLGGRTGSQSGRSPPSMNSGLVSVNAAAAGSLRFEGR